MTEQIAPHMHRWIVQIGDGSGKIEIVANSPCDICGLTPEAVANTATIKTLLAEIERLSAIIATLPIATTPATREAGDAQ